MRNHSLRILTAALAMTTTLASLATEAFGQIEEIIVTTRKREENLQDVPIVITAFSAASIERKGIASLEDVAKYTNGLILDEGFSKQDTRITIRGLSPTRGRQNVAVLQDDVDISSLAISTAGGSFTINPRLIDIERIEIVKGPHSALYGRSAFNGAINYITKKPGNEFVGNAQAEVGTHKKAEARGSISGPLLKDKLSVGFNAGIWTFGGFYDSAVSGGDLGGNNGKGLAGSFVLTPTDMFKVTGRVEWSDDHFDPEARSILNPTGTLPTPTSALGTSTVAPTGAVFLSTNVNNLSFPQVFGTLGTAKSFPKPAPSRDPRTGQDYPGSDRQIFRTTLRAEADFEAALLTSITHYGDTKALQYGDQFGVGDASDPLINGFQETNFNTTTKLFSEELRLQSQGDSALKWLVGGLFWNELAKQDSRSTVCASSGGGCAADIRATLAFGGGNYFPRNITKRDTHHWSSYLSLDYAITDRLKLSAEARYTKEKEDTTSPFSTSPSIIGCAGTGAPGGRTISATTGLVVCGPFGPNTVGPLILVSASAAQIATNPGFILPTNPFYLAAQVKSDFWTPRVTIDFKATDDALLYASFAQAKKPGGYASIGGGSTLADNVFDEESMKVYEAGAKTEWMDNRLQFNMATYFQDFAKKQVQVVVINELTGLPTTKTVNAAKAEVKGFEIDAQAAPTDNVSFTLGYTYNDAKYKNFKDVTNSVSTVTRAGNCTVTTVRLASGAQAQRCIVDYSGRRLEGAPKHNVQLGGELRGDMGGGTQWFVDAESRYQSSRFTTFENTLKVPSYWNVDMRIGVRTGGWSITTYVNNIFNDDHLKANAVYIPNWNISFLPPRNTVISGASALLPDKRQFGIRANATF